MSRTRPSEPQGYLIGEAAERSGISAVNIRYYEKQGLVGAQGRAGNSYRLYDDDDVHRLRFVRLCRAMDMSLDEVRTLLALDLRSKADCDAACVTLDAHLGHVRERLRELQALETELVALRGCCDGGDATCHIIETL
ncbi:MAG: Cd(II)/Pb(II)-responsive transcriptional regulator, partial [Comamonadaceae bacterium]